MDFSKYFDTDKIQAGISTGSTWWNGKGETISSYSPVDGKLIGQTDTANRDDFNKAIEQAEIAWKHWRQIPKTSIAHDSAPWIEEHHRHELRYCPQQPKP